MKAISMDLRKRIVEAYDAGEGTLQERADRFKVSIYVVKKLLSQNRKLGSLESQNHQCGRKAMFNEKDSKFEEMKSIDEGGEEALDLALKKWE